MAQRRAKRGGQQGTNGEWYEGGKFLPSTQRPKRAPVRSQGTGRVEIAPREWASPLTGMRAIYPLLTNIFQIAARDASGAVSQFGDWDNNTYAQAAQMDDAQGRVDLRDRWNAGERWTPIRVYHTTPGWLREEIARHGIDFRRGVPSTDYTMLRSPAGNYFWGSKSAALQDARHLRESFPADVWEVDAGEIEFRKGVCTWGGLYTSEPIPPTQIRLVPE